MQICRPGSDIIPTTLSPLSGLLRPIVRKIMIGPRAEISAGNLESVTDLKRLHFGTKVVQGLTLVLIRKR